jgi:hypothetical protein
MKGSPRTARAGRQRGQEMQRPGNSNSSGPRCRSDRLAAGRSAVRPRDRLRARRPDDAPQHRRVVQPGVQEHWPEGLLVAFGPPDVRHPGRSHRAQGRRLAAGRAIAGGPPVDPDHTAVHRWRQRCSAQARRDDLKGYGRAECNFTSSSDQPAETSQNSERARLSHQPCRSADPCRLWPRRVSNID